MTELLRLPRLGVTRTPPENLTESDENSFEHEYRKDIPECNGQRLENIEVLSNGFLVRGPSPLKQSFAAHHSGPSRAMRFIRAVTTMARVSTRLRVENALFVTDEFSNGFFHWFCDVLPRLEAVDASAPEEYKGFTLVVPAMAVSSYVQPSLSAYEKFSFRLMGSHEAASCTNLHVIPPVAPTGNYRPALMCALRERFKRLFAPRGGVHRIFISRSKAPRRKLANEGQLVPVLGRHGVTSLVAEEQSFEEQVRQIGAASVLVGSHGAGLTHMLWLKPGSRVLELRRRGDRWNNCYFSLASALGLKYYYLMCDPVNPRDDFHRGDMVVDPAAFDKVLSELHD